MNRLFFVVLCNTCFAALAPWLAAETPLSFVQDIRPILSDKCFACHGPDENTREAGLRLDIREEAVEHGALVPGKAAESEIVARLLSDDEDERMPPPHIRKDLSAGEIELIRRWVDQGANYESHWAYRELVRPSLPANTTDNPVDAFLASTLADHGLAMSPAADKTTLARRLYLDLLGVPPHRDELQAFLDDESPAAWEALVERLLKDQRFGERMAVYWLDLVRYADTIGYHSDTSMEVSAYRDYVIEAFNRNKPFDQFTIEQLAGDLLPEPTESQRVASGYNRLLQTTEEGGAQAKEYIAIYAADRVRNVSGVWMGSTVGCAQCHDHKYDPITTRDFYSLAAFFADIKENAIGKRSPNLKLYSEADRNKIASLKEKIASLHLPKLLETNSELAADVSRGQKAWESQTLASDAGESLWRFPEPSLVEATGGAELQRQADGSYLAKGKTPDRGSYQVELAIEGKVSAISLEVFSDPSFPNQGFSPGNGNFVLTQFKVRAGDRDVPIAAAEADFEQKGWPVANTLDGKSKTGWAVDGHQTRAAKRTAIFRFKDPIELSGTQRLQIEMKHESGHVRHLVGRFRLGVTDRPAAELKANQPVPEELLVIIRKSPADRSEAEATKLAAHYQTFAPELQPWKDKRAAAEKELKGVEGAVRTMLVTESLKEPRMTRVLSRGNWLDDSGEVVVPSVPEFLAFTEIKDRRANRLDLARWLVDKRNPLTSRTFVNRLWSLYFGRGISENLDDLGGQGQPPSHPELLDWLSVEFVESGWDTKHLIRLLVNSDAYRQSSVASRELAEVDPGNRWYARQGRWRLDAEFVRDTLLAVSGLLDDSTIGGRSVKPYQPAGYWQHLNFPKRTWQAGPAEQLYRRSLYTFWCRTFLHPAMLAFDATSREECTAQRARSNIPQQALVLLNDPAFVEASRVFAESILDQPGGTKEKLRWAFAAAVSRPPAEEEVRLLQDLLQNQQTRYAQDAEGAAALISVGAAPVGSGRDPAQLAAWTQVARALFNLYETTSRF